MAGPHIKPAESGPTGRLPARRLIRRVFRLPLSESHVAGGCRFSGTPMTAGRSITCQCTVWTINGQAGGVGVTIQAAWLESLGDVLGQPTVKMKATFSRKHQRSL